nr:hypothetical protein [Tanacetum cinerariifolium]
LIGRRDAHAPPAEDIQYAISIALPFFPPRLL